MAGGSIDPTLSLLAQQKNKTTLAFIAFWALFVYTLFATIK